MNLNARNTDPATSHTASEAVGGKRQQTIRARLYAAFMQAGDSGLTRTEAAQAAGVDEWSASKRVSDLARDRLIEDTGWTRKGSGREQTVWRCAP